MFTLCAWVLGPCTCTYGGTCAWICAHCKASLQNGCSGWARTFPFPRLRNPDLGRPGASRLPAQPAQEQARARQGFTRRPARGPRAFQDDNQLYLSQLVKCIFSVYQMSFPLLQVWSLCQGSFVSPFEASKVLKLDSWPPLVPTFPDGGYPTDHGTFYMDI